MSKKKTSARRKNSSKSSKKQAGFFTDSFLGQAFKWLFVVGLWVGIFGVLLMAWYARELPSITRGANFGPKISTTILATDGSMLARYGEIRGKSLDIDEISPYLVKAVLATEDRRFYHHFGLDPLGLLRAFTTNTIKGRVVQGGSTITQQLAKNLFLTQERTYKRKIQEAMLALWLEMELSKDEILSAYLNRVYMGAGAYGVEAASRLYFNKDAKDLNLREAATIAGLLKAPSRYSPTNNPQLARERSNVVIAAMLDAGEITKEEAKNLNEEPPPPEPVPGEIDAVRYFTDWVIDGVNDLVGTPEEDLIIETTLVPGFQDKAEEALGDALLKATEAEKNISQGAVIVMDPGGAVLAMVGGRDYKESKFNRATQAKRPPGSSFKPIVYMTALENGYRPMDMVNDAPITTGRYRPANYGGKYYGELTMENALALSLNTIAFQLAKAVGPQAIINMANRLGIYSNLQPDLSIALGSNGVSLLEMGTVYSTLANGGYRTIPFAIKSIKGKDGYVYYERREGRPSVPVISAALDDTITGMLQKPLEYGTAQGAKLPWPASGKTGTSQDSRDALFCGYTDDLVTVVWMGNDDNSPMKNVTGGSYPAQIWRNIMVYGRGKHTYGGKRERNFFTDGFDSLMGRLIGGPGDDMTYGMGTGTEMTPQEERRENILRLPDGYTPKSAEYNN